jgi:drug/metabolite transporter (DMT)-like permease
MGELISLFTAVCWTVTVISFEYAGKRVGSLAVNMIRLLLGFVFISLFLWATRGMIVPLDATTHTWNWLLLSGFVGLVIGDYFLFQAFVDVGGRISLIILNVVPPLSAILGFIYFGETIGIYGVIGMTITIGAIIYVIYHRQDSSNHPNALKGAIFAFIGAIAQAVGLLLSKEGMGDYNAFAATQIRIISAIVGFTLIIAIRGRWKEVGRAFHQPKSMLFITIGSIFGPFLGIASSLFALQYTEVGIATTISQLNIIMIIPFSIFLFGESVSVKEIVGSLVAIGGVAILFLT